MSFTSECLSRCRVKWVTCRYPSLASWSYTIISGVHCVLPSLFTISFIEFTKEIVNRVFWLHGHGMISPLLIETAIKWKLKVRITKWEILFMVSSHGKFSTLNYWLYHNPSSPPPIPSGHGAKHLSGSGQEYPCVDFLSILYLDMWKINTVLNGTQRYRVVVFSRFPILFGRGGCTFSAKCNLINLDKIHTSLDNTVLAVTINYGVFSSFSSLSYFCL